jgi:HrpA-like RNA helicase
MASSIKSYRKASKAHQVKGAAVAMPTQSRELPIQKYLPEILSSLSEHRVIELFAPTGTGKSTGFATEFVAKNHAEGLSAYCLMSIPTVVGVNTLYNHVSIQLADSASRFGCGAGGNYTDNFEKADLSVCTTQVVINHLLRLYASKNSMKDLIVVIDEAHHTSSENYVLIYLCDWLIEKGFGLRVLIMTATPSVYDLKFLVATKTFRISRDEVVHHEITEYWLHTDIFSVRDILKCQTPFTRIVDEIMHTITRALDVSSGNGLIFVPGEGEAEELASFCRIRFQQIQFDTIYSSMDRAEIDEAIKPVSGVRKIIIATNIAECSVTFDIDFVIDTLCHKEMVMRNRNGRVYGELAMNIISEAARLQRRGRCGRIRHGHYFAMCTRSFNEQMIPHTISSFVNGDKAMSVLSLMRSNMPAFEILRMNPPDIVQVIKRLAKFGLYDAENNTCSKLGREVTGFSLPLEFTVFLLSLQQEMPDSMMEACLLIAIVAAKDATQSPFYFPKGMKGIAKQEFLEDKFSDYFHHDDITGILKLVCEVITETEWCGRGTGKYMREHNLNEKFFRQVVRILNQTMPRFFKSRPSLKEFDEISRRIDSGEKVFARFYHVAKRFFPVYNMGMGGRYYDFQHELFNPTPYTLDNCRLSRDLPLTIVAFSYCAITVPNKKAGVGMVTMNLLSMCVPEV